ncbi:phytoene/squalene synthase family protein [Ferruginibacter sp. SUN002]|uniref:phytoene/squalene synthase family protein n=1 Tax=Ferruginibacter sp. SUN002 TaxID=2937789 RepID=UPI003D36E042
MINLFNELSHNCSRATTERYSTSFNSAVNLLHRSIQKPIHNIYGFVRLADEIVDTFHQYNQSELLAEFKRETYVAIERGISLNPILNSFQLTVNEYQISHDLIDAFFRSMEMDLNKVSYNDKEYCEYIYGSAEVVGLMCLFVFCDSDKEKYQQLKPYARLLGSAFQKVNFLRDAKADYQLLSRTYFPGVDFTNFTPSMKRQIEDDIKNDFEKAYKGIIQLPVKARFGVYVAYKYYWSLFKKIQKTNAEKILEQRIRIPNFSKLFIVAKAGLRSQLNIL